MHPAGMGHWGQVTLKHGVMKVFLPPKSDIVANAVKLCEQHVYMCMCVAPSAFMYKRLYLSCNSSLQTPAAASGQVCGCPRLP